MSTCSYVRIVCRTWRSCHVAAPPVGALCSTLRPEMLRYLAELRIGPGTELRMLGDEPFGAGVRVEIDGTEHGIGERLAKRVLVATA